MKEHVIIRWNDLEQALHMLAAPDKSDQVTPALDALKELNITAQPQKVAYTLIAAAAYLTSDVTPYADA